MTQPKLSVVINTKDVEETLERTLKSVEFADEIILVDMHSSDQTIKIAKQFTNKIYQHDDVGYVEPARNFALAKASHDWILVIDADEVITAELKEIILTTISQQKAADIYWLPRKNMIFGQWIMRTGWWPDYQPRLFRKGKITWQEGIHSFPDPQGKEVHFPAEERYALLHHNYTSVSQFLTRLNTYTSIQAQEPASKSSQADFSAEQLMETFSNEFARRALMLNGVEDGLHGTSLSLLQAMYESVIYLKQWEKQGFTPTKTENMGKILQSVQQIWAYWWADYQVRNSSGLLRVYWQIRRKLKA
jgi:glycosyltransferase involved in cell wall biosynthesis